MEGRRQKETKHIEEDKEKETKRKRGREAVA